jgi:glutamyl-tRNA reductase
MQLVSYGISFHNTALPEREPLVFSESQQRQILAAIHQSGQTHEGLILCTCNRTEIYLYVSDEFNTDLFLAELITQINPDAARLWKKHSIINRQGQAVRHLFTVAAGLDSQMIGESQIIRQIKDAYTQAIESRTTKFFFHRLIHSAFRASKAVRTQTEINSGAVSISSAAVELAREKIDLSKSHVLMIGAGENASMAAEYLILAGIGGLTVASRTLESACGLVSHLTIGRPITLSDIPEALAQADLILCSTASEAPVLTVREHGYLLSQRKKPMVIIDIAVPRDVEPAIGDMAEIQLYNIEDLNQQVQKNLAQRNSHIPAAREIIDRHVLEYEQWIKSLDVAQVVASLAEEYQKLARSEAERYSRLFPDLNYEELQKFSESLVKKVLYGPISYLKNAGRDELASDQLETVEIIKKMLLEVDRKRGGQ